jgi:hypothetical protein
MPQGFANCFSFACTHMGTVNGVKLASCTCPINEAATGAAATASAATPIAIKAVAGCNQLVVGTST